MAKDFKLVRMTLPEISIVIDALRYDRQKNGDDSDNTKGNLEKELIAVSEVNL